MNCCDNRSHHFQQPKKNDNVNKVITTPIRQVTKQCTDKRQLTAPAPPAPVRSRSRSRANVYTPSYRDIVLPNSCPLSTVSPTANINRADDGFMMVSNRKKRKKKLNMCGTATGPCKIQVAEQICAIYISRLTKSTTIDNIKEHLTERGQECIDIQLLKQQKETDFNSFKITIAQNKLDVFLGNSFWPVGVKYRKYREYTHTRDNRNPPNQYG